MKNVDTKDGSIMLEHIFGNDNKNVHNNLSKQTGLKEDQVSGIMAQLAPLLMGILGKKKFSEKASNLPRILQY